MRNSTIDLFLNVSLVKSRQTLDKLHHSFRYNSLYRSGNISIVQIVIMQFQTKRIHYLHLLSHSCPKKTAQCVYVH